MGLDYGLREHLDKRGTPCAYCLKPSVHTFVVWKRGALDHRVGLCEDHRREPEPPRTAVRGGQGEQTALDVGDA